MSRFKTSPCMTATLAHVFQHVRELPVHTGHHTRQNHDHAHNHTHNTPHRSKEKRRSREKMREKMTEKEKEREREREREKQGKEKIKRSRENEEEINEKNFLQNMFENLRIRQMNQLKMFRKKFLSDELFFIFLSKVQNLTVFSIIYMIRIRFFGPREIIQNGFRAAQYSLRRHSQLLNQPSIVGFCSCVVQRDDKELFGPGVFQKNSRQESAEAQFRASVEL